MTTPAEIARSLTDARSPQHKPRLASMGRVTITAKGSNMTTQQQTERERLAGLLEREASSYTSVGNQAQWADELRKAAALLRGDEPAKPDHAGKLFDLVYAHCCLKYDPGAAMRYSNVADALLHIVAIADTRDIEATSAGFKVSKAAVYVPYELIEAARLALREAQIQKPITTAALTTTTTVLKHGRGKALGKGSE